VRIKPAEGQEGQVHVPVSTGLCDTGKAEANVPGHLHAIDNGHDCADQQAAVKSTQAAVTVVCKRRRSPSDEVQIASALFGKLIGLCLFVSDRRPHAQRSRAGAVQERMSGSGKDLCVSAREEDSVGVSRAVLV
jgi:hypothetical protein